MLLKTIKQLIFEHLGKDVPRKLIYEEVESLFGVSHLTPKDAHMFALSPEEAEEKLRLDRERAEKVDSDLTKCVSALKSMKEATSRTVFCAYWYDDIDDNQYHVLLFREKDILKLPSIPVWGRVDVSCCGEHETPYEVDFEDLDDNQIKALLACVHLIPAPLEWTKDDLPMVLGSAYNPENSELLLASNVLADCIHGKGGKLPNYIMFEDGVIPFEIREDTYSERHLAEREADQRRAVLRSFIRLYKSMLETKAALLSEREVSSITMQTFQEVFLKHFKKHGYEALEKLRADILEGEDDGYIDDLDSNVSYLFGTLLTKKIKPRQDLLFVLYNSISSSGKTSHISMLYDTKRVREMENLVHWDRVSSIDALDDYSVIAHLCSMRKIPWAYNWGCSPYDDYLGALVAPYAEDMEYEFILDVLFVIAESMIEEGEGYDRDPNCFDDGVVPLPSLHESAEDAEYNAGLRRRVLCNYLNLYKALKAARDALCNEHCDSNAPRKDEDND